MVETKGEITSLGRKRHQRIKLIESNMIWNKKLSYSGRLLHGCVYPDAFTV